MLRLSRHNFFKALMLIAIAAGLFTSLYGYYRFFNHDAWFLSDETSLKNRLYADEAVFINSALSLPHDARILVFRQYWMANYYLYPRKLFYIAPSDANESEIDELVKKKKIEWMFLEGEKGLVKLIGVK